MVLAGTAAEARKYVTDYQANPSGYVVAVNQATNQTMIMTQIKDTVLKERQKLEKKYNPLNMKSTEKSHTFKARIKRIGGGLILTTSLYINGAKVEEATSEIPSTFMKCNLQAQNLCKKANLACIGMTNLGGKIPASITQNFPSFSLIPTLNRDAAVCIP